MTVVQALIAFSIAAGLLTLTPGLDVALVVRAIHRHAAERRAERAPRHSPTLEQLAAEHAARDQLLADAIASVRARPIPNRYSRGVVRREPDPPPYIIVPHDFTEDRPWSPPPWLS